MPKVAVHGIRLGGTGFDIDIVLFTIFNHLLTSGKGLAEISIAPGGEDFKIRSKSRKGELETALIISLAGGSVGKGGGTELAGDFNLCLGDQWAGDGGAQ